MTNNATEANLKSHAAETSGTVTAHHLTLADLAWARRAYKANEPRDVFYRTATELVSLALRGGVISLSTTEALAVLLQTWNKNFYRFGKREFNEEHVVKIDDLLVKYKECLAACRPRRIEDLHEQERLGIVCMFQEFENVLGPVGAAKALHLLAPALLPLWDVAIAINHRLRLGRVGSNGDRYWRLMLLAKRQCLDLQQQGGVGNLLKQIDEYN
jgi:hypothetical protein